MSSHRVLTGVLLLLALAVCWAQQGPELCVNGGFEQGTAGWSFVFGGYQLAPAGWGKAGSRALITPLAAHSGATGLVLDAIGLTDEVDVYSQPMTVRAGYGYRLGSFVKLLAGKGNYKVTLDWQQPDGKHIAYDNDWRGGGEPPQFTLHGGVFVPPPGAGRAVIILGVGPGSKYAFDDISLRELGPAEPLDARPRRNGDGKIEVGGPAKAAAAEPATWIITYTVGESGLPVGGGLKIARSNVNFEWGELQATDPKAANYVSATGPRGAQFNLTGGNDLTVSLGWPALQPGEEVVVTLGDTAGGGPGLVPQFRPEAGLQWVVSSDCKTDGAFAEVGRSAPFEVVPGKAIIAWATVPYFTFVGVETPVAIEVWDTESNVVSDFQGTMRLGTSDRHAKLPTSVQFRAGTPARQQIMCTFSETGFQAILATCPGLGEGRPFIRNLVVLPQTAPLLPPPDGRVHCHASADVAVLSNDHLAAVFPRMSCGFGLAASDFGYAALYARVGDAWRPVGALNRLGLINRLRPGIQHGDEPAPWRAEVASAGPESASLVFSSGQGGVGDIWPMGATFTLGREAEHISMTETADASAGHAELLACSLPTLCAGDWRMGATKRGALFPGLEYLTADEKSSDDKGVASKLRGRGYPHPYKNTVPLMAVTFDDATVGLMWDPGQKWDGEHPVMLPDFDSSRTQTRMGLRAGFDPQRFKENDATAPVAVAFDKPRGLRLSADIFILGGSHDVTDAVAYYAKTHPLPQAKLIRTYPEELALCARGQMEIAWDPKTKGWLSAMGQEHSMQPDVADQLLQTSLLVGDPAMAQKMRAQAEEAIQKWGVGGVQLNFRRGNAAEAVAAVRAGAGEAMGGQHPEGFWTFSQVYSMEGQRATLARPEDVELGTCVFRLQPILRWAVISGDPAATEAGLRGLEYIKRFTKPAGAESWEVPLVCPNLRAAALACECYLNGWRLTGKAEYLEKARYWAWAGMAFIYLWEAPDRPVMPGASISVFGTTFYTHPWFGAAVQWVGLVYAQSLQYLAQFDDTYPWQKVAALITSSAMRQQKTDASPCKHVGMFPDAYNVVWGKDYYEWCLAPTLITANVIGLMGREAAVATALVPGVTPQIHITSVAQPGRMSYDAQARTLTIGLRYYPQETAQATVFGVTEPQAVEWNGQALPRVADITAASEGWTIPRREHYLVVKLRCAAEAGELALRGVTPAPYQEPTVPSEILNGGFESGLAEWQADPGAVIDVEQPHSGKACLRLTSPDPLHEMQTTSEAMRVEGGKLYRLAAWVRQVAGAGQYKVTINWLDQAGGHLAYDNDWRGDDHPAQWTLHGGLFRAPAQARQARLILGVRDGTCLFDDLALTAQ